MRTRQFFSVRNLSTWLAFLVLLANLVPTQADEKEDEYLRIFDIVQVADTEKNAGKLKPAQAKYREAETALRAFRRNYPEWNPASVSYRLNYLATKISEVSDRIAESTSTPPIPSQGQEQSRAEPEGSGPAVKLLEPGVEPRKMLRLHPKAGDKQVLELSMQPTMEGKVGSLPKPPTKIPGMKIVFELTVKDISVDGDINYQAVITDATAIAGPGVDAQTAQAFTSALGQLKGVSDAGIISQRGFEKGAQLEMPADAGEALGQMLETFSNLTIPLPEEAIGTGAKWEARSQVKSRGIALQQTATYDLTSLDRERAAIRISTTQHAANKMDARGTGNVNLLLTQVMPSSGTIDFHSEIKMPMNMGPQRQPMLMKADLSVTLESK